MASGFWNIGKIPELRKRLLFSAVILAVYCIGVFISVPGVDRVELAKAFEQLQGTLFGFFNAPLFATFIVGMFWRRMTPTAGWVGLVAGMFFGFSFGLGGLGAAALGQLADIAGIEAVYRATPYLLLLGLLTAFLPRQPSEPKQTG